MSEDNDFALVPNKGYPRLLRYDLPDNDLGLVAELTPALNLLRINRKLYDSLREMEQNIVIKTRKLRLYMTDVIFT